MIHRLGLILLGMLLACLGLEAVLRVWDVVPDVGSPLSRFCRRDADLGWIGRPDVNLRYHRPEFDTLVRHDADGWREPAPARPAEPTRRILVLGDSFTWGWGVGQGELFTDRLQSRLPPKVAVYNRGVVGFGTGQEYLLLERELAVRAYDTVVVMFFINDLKDNTDGKEGHRPYFELVDDRMLARNQPAVFPTGALEQSFEQHSRAYLFLEFELGMLKRRFVGEANDERAYRTSAAVDVYDVPGQAITARLLGEMHRLARAHGARFVLVYIPQRSEIEGDAPYPFVRAVHALIDDIARREGFPVVDLAAPFHQQAKAGGALVYPIDAHWTPAGHQLAADVLLSSPIFGAESDGP